MRESHGRVDVRAPYGCSFFVPERPGTSRSGKDRGQVQLELVGIREKELASSRRGRIEHELVLVSQRGLDGVEVQAKFGELGRARIGRLPLEEGLRFAGRSAGPVGTMRFRLKDLTRRFSAQRGPLAEPVPDGLADAS